MALINKTRIKTAIQWPIELNQQAVSFIAGIIYRQAVDSIKPTINHEYLWYSKIHINHEMRGSQFYNLFLNVANVKSNNKCFKTLHTESSYVSERLALVSTK